MTGDVVIFGVYVPALLLLALGSLVATGVLTRMLQSIGFYALVAYRPIVDLCLFAFILCLAVLLTAPAGSRP